ncbi:hypothetical protein BV394_02080 [Brevirhabdus pacifica]|uniref:Uncharacterized protein n=1 Tax=Brevirhabdus pacifica TaxID=1267768 RepID=A0A1U7DFL3_9RHOB|nr:RusA family crossover junction endodeoxyribonuclease [Brevirhabdus pacifica]APX88668.1 hypothetical protein BV394_02080 [Brevirhabdus pacifica]PJJ86828.1 crossover junction endodeoxyribonuclease RusA [Brevirhabdus pacifica]
MTISLNLPFPVPLSACFHNVRGRGRATTPRYAAYQREAGKMILAQGSPKVAGPVVLEVDFTAPDRRARDGDNLLKCVFDTLVKAGVIEDDNNRVIVASSFRWVHDQTPCRVTVRPVAASVGAA